MKKPAKIRKGQAKLTPAQKKYVKWFGQNQIEKYLSTKQELTDKQVELCMRNAYKVSGNSLPEKIIWFESPEQFCKHWASVRDSVWASVGASVRASVWASVRASVGDSVGASVWASVGDSVGASVWASVRDSVWASVWASVGDSVWASVGASVRDSVRDSVGASVRDSVGASVRDSVGASVWAYYDADDLSFYLLFHEFFKNNNFVWLAKVAENTTGYGTFHKEAWLVRKPTILTRDEQGRLHDESDMAIKWSDGYGFYFWHGTRVTEKIIKTPEKLTKKDWLNETNAEVRRVIQDRIEDFPKVIGAKKVAKDEWGELVEVKLPDDPEEIARYVKVKDSSTPRIYYLRVPPTMTTPKQAIGWTFGMEEGYEPEEQS